jgi:hypothetical protein
MRSLVVVFLLFAAAPSAAQLVSRPTDPPIVTAENDSWYRLREPLQFAGDIYVPAGATVFFDGNRMIRTGHYNGVPLYADTTIEPFSVVFVPIGHGVLQPYARARNGELTGTAASRAPLLPRQTAGTTATGRDLPMAAVSPTALPQPLGAISAFTPETGAVGTSGVTRRVDATTIVGTGGSIAAGPPLITARRPESSDGVWLDFMGEKWVSAGTAVPLRATDFVRVGDYAGFPVFARQGLNEEVIYLPTRAGLVAPYKLKP